VIFIDRGSLAAPCRISLEAAELHYLLNLEHFVGDEAGEMRMQEDRRLTCRHDGTRDRLPYWALTLIAAPSKGQR
jgi:hypothetical protein